MQRGREALLWTGLGVALSAPLVDLAAHVATSPWARAVPLFAALFAFCAWTDPGPRRPSRDGWLWLAIGLAVSLVGVAGGMTRTGRPGIALAAIGLARALGRPAPLRAGLAAWIVPVPSALQNAAAPGLAALVAHAAVQAGALLGLAGRVDASHVGRLVVEAQGGSLDLFPGDGGLPLVWTLAGVGWFATVRRAGTIGSAFRSAARFALAAIPLQLAALALACGAALLGASDLGRALLDHVVIGAALVGLGLATRAGAATAQPAVSRA